MISRVRRIGILAISGFLCSCSNHGTLGGHDGPGSNPYDDNAIVWYTQQLKSKDLLPEEQAKIYFNRAQAYQQQRQFERAIADYDTAVILRPRYVEAYYNRGLTQARLRNYGRALTDFGVVIRIDPDYALAYFARGAVYNISGDFPLAIEDLSTSIRLKPDLILAYSERGNAYFKNRKYDEALQDYDKAVSLGPDMAQLYISRGAVHGFKGQLEKSLNDIDQGLRLKPDAANTANAYYIRGWIHAQKGRYGQAIDDLDKTIALKPNDAYVHLARGAFKFSAGRFSDAEKDIEHSVVLKPEVTYYVAWLMLARKMTGQADIAVLRRNAYDIDRRIWPGPIVALYFGEMAPEAVRAASKKGKVETQKMRDCEVDFFIGEYELLRGNPGAAKTLLTKAGESCQNGDREFERIAAAAELKRMKP